MFILTIFLIFAVIWVFIGILWVLDKLTGGLINDLLD